MGEFCFSPYKIFLGDSPLPMLIFFLVYFSPCNAGLYSPVGVKNELEKKINIARGKSHKKNI
jgi:hypothetical protein